MKFYDVTSWSYVNLDDPVSTTAKRVTLEVRRAGIDYHRLCRRLVEVRRVRFEYRKGCRRLVEVWRVRFGYHKACRSLVEDRRVRCAKRVGGLWKFGEPDLSS